MRVRRSDFESVLLQHVCMWLKAFLFVEIVYGFTFIIRKRYAITCEGHLNVRRLLSKELLN